MKYGRTELVNGYEVCDYYLQMRKLRLNSTDVDQVESDNHEMLASCMIAVVVNKAPTQFNRIVRVCVFACRASDMAAVGMRKCFAFLSLLSFSS